jgi:predicted alpha/beta-hydrolase family hydrolase
MLSVEAMEEVRIPVGEGGVSASVHGAGGTVVVLGHGAGSHRKHPALLSLAEALAASGRRVLLYNFPYTDARRRSPDPPAVLEAATRAAGEFARSSLGARRLVHGGRSMGGRIASQVVAQGAPADALVFLAYPLHPPGQPERLRDRHLPAIPVPMLFLQGTRDAFARPDLLDAVLARLGPAATLHRVQDADHSFAVPRRAGRSPAEVQEELVAVITGWLSERGL